MGNRWQHADSLQIQQLFAFFRWIAPWMTGQIAFAVAFGSHRRKQHNSKLPIKNQ
jgi:hypothetical protein